MGGYIAVRCGLSESFLIVFFDRNLKVGHGGVLAFINQGKEIRIMENLLVNCPSFCALLMIIKRCLKKWVNPQGIYNSRMLSFG
jgi:hypothetical protein